MFYGAYSNVNRKFSLPVIVVEFRGVGWVSPEKVVSKNNGIVWAFALRTAAPVIITSHRWRISTKISIDIMCTGISHWSKVYSCCVLTSTTTALPRVTRQHRRSRDRHVGRCPSCPVYNNELLDEPPVVFGPARRSILRRSREHWNLAEIWALGSRPLGWGPGWPLKPATSLATKRNLVVVSWRHQHVGFSESLPLCPLKVTQGYTT